MVKLILGHKGAGKTKKLIELVNAAVEATNGNVVCVEKQPLLTTNITHRVRLTATDDYKVSGYDAFYGFIAGILASDHDCTDIFVDATLRIIGRDYDKVGEMFEKLEKISADTTITCTISADNSELSDNIKKFVG